MVQGMKTPHAKTPHAKPKRGGKGRKVGSVLCCRPKRRTLLAVGTVVVSNESREGRHHETTVGPSRLRSCLAHGYLSLRGLAMVPRVDLGKQRMHFSKRLTSFLATRKLLLIAVLGGLFLLFGVLPGVVNNWRNLGYVSARLGIEASNWDNAGQAFEALFAKGTTRDQVHAILQTVDPGLTGRLPNALPECHGEVCCERVDAFVDSAGWWFHYVFCYDPSMKLEAITLAY